ncbi:MAG: hypothetical protein KC933_04430 [Myxococcales bacterium]|nr:hypothetical protein [Myxococcales bacterium]
MDPGEQLEHPIARELQVLEKKRYDFERPTPTHYTLEVAAYWDNDLLDQVESGRRRRVTVGAYTAGRRTHLIVELPLDAKRFTLARIRGRTAFITVPEQAQVALRTDDGQVSREVTRRPTSAPFPAYAVQIGFGDRLAFRVGKLTFVCQFVRAHGRARHVLDWLMPY